MIADKMRLTPRCFRDILYMYCVCVYHNSLFTHSVKVYLLNINKCNEVDYLAQITVNTVLDTYSQCGLLLQDFSG